MSGGGGPDYGFTRNAGGRDECAGLRREKPLQVPNPDVVGSLVPGDVLALRLDDGDNPTIAAITPGNEEAGAIMPDQQLVDCLRLGMPFDATVRTVNGAQILLAVHPG